MGSSLQIQARALGDPTRHRIFRFVADADQPVGVADLTTHLGLNHNAIRQHLAKLVDARLLVETAAAPNGRGRPKLLYRIDPSSDSRWGVTGPYERLAILLAEIVRTGDEPEVVGHRAGRRLRLGATTASADPTREFTEEMARQGFEPELHPTSGGFSLVLANCPFVSAALADQSTVCRLHLGLARGVAEAIGGVEVEGLEPRDPRRANCRLTCRHDDTAATPPTDAAPPTSEVAPDHADRRPDLPSTEGRRPARAVPTGTELR